MIKCQKDIIRHRNCGLGDARSRESSIKCDYGYMITILHISCLLYATVAPKPARMRSDCCTNSGERCMWSRSISLDVGGGGELDADSV